jgi:iron complex transport system permease protein
VLVVVTAALLVGVAVSLLVGSHPIAPDRVWHALTSPDGSTDAAVVRGQRVPRTVLALVVGAALGLAGAVMQALTRNPLADPGILGVNAGASLAVVLGVALTGVAGIWSYVWFALAGAAVAAIGVHLLAGAGRQIATPARLALAGVAVSAALMALTQTVVLADQRAFDAFRSWVTGSLEGRRWDVLAATAPFLALGALLAAVLGPSLGVLVLGEETAHGVGVRVRRTRVLALVTVTLLAGGATAAIGPVGFVGLAAPMIARAYLGHHLRWVMAASCVLGALWLTAADVLARVVVAPQEIGAGVVAAIVGGPLFVALVQRRRMPAL